MDENEIEIKVEKMIDRLDFQYLKGVIDASEYDEKMKEIELLSQGIDKGDKKGLMNFDYSEYKDDREYNEDSQYGYQVEEEEY